MAPGPTQILVILILFLLFFGTSRLAEIGKGLGEGIRNFKKGLQDDPSDAPRRNEADKRLPPAASKEVQSKEVQSKELQSKELQSKELQSKELQSKEVQPSDAAEAERDKV